MKVFLVVIGPFLTFWGLRQIPRLLALVGQEDNAYLLGRVMAVAAQIALGVVLTIRGIKAHLQPTEDERGEGN